MKVALLLSGQPRNIEQAFNSIKHCLIEPNNPDIFIHTWLDLENERHKKLENLILNLYNPKKIKIEKQKKFSHNNLELSRILSTHAIGYTKESFIEMIYSSWYSNHQSNLLKEEYRLENDFEYDYVIRARFDIYYNNPLICSNYDNNKLYTTPRVNLPPEMIDDRFCFGSNKLMNIYCGGFNLIDYLIEYRNTLDGIFCGETIVYEIFRIFNIPNEIISDVHIERIHFNGTF
jgi:hypothetical protein